MELIRGIESIGGEIWVEGTELLVSPGDFALPVLDELRQHQAEIIVLLQSRADAPSPDELVDGVWMLEECVYGDRWWGGIGALYLSLARWSAGHGRPLPASRRDFVAALVAEGFQVTSEGLVYGLVLKADLEAHLRFSTSEQQTRSKPSKSVGVAVKSTALSRNRRKSEV